MRHAPRNRRSCPMMRGIPWKHHSQRGKPWWAQRRRHSRKRLADELPSRLGSARRGRVLESVARISATPWSTDCVPPRHLLTAKLSWRRLQCSKTSAGKSGMTRSSCFKRRLACRARPLDGVRFVDCVISGKVCLCCKRQAMRVVNERAGSGQTQSNSNAARALQNTPQRRLTSKYPAPNLQNQPVPNIFE